MKANIEGAQGADRVRKSGGELLKEFLAVFGPLSVVYLIMVVVILSTRWVVLSVLTPLIAR